MQEITIGKKSTFAIQYRHGQQDQKMGFVRLWLGDIYLGADDEVYFSYLLGDLQFIINNRERLMDFPFRDDLPETIMQKMSDLGIQHRSLSKHKISFGESFDDFLIVCFFTDGKVHFVWKLREKPFFTYPGYPQAAQMASLDYDYFESIVKRFNEELVLSMAKFKH